MRNNVLQYLFIIIVLAFIIGAAFMIYKEKEKVTENTIVENISQSQFMKDVRIGIASFDKINPLLSNNRNLQDISKIIYEPLLSITPDYKLENCLAVEYSKSGDRIYLIKLRENVKWHDGSKFDAEDVKFTIDKLKNEAASSIYAENVKHITNVEVIDKNTIKIELDEEIPFFEYHLIFPILSAKQYMGKDFANVEMTPAGTGMYRIEQWNSAGIKLVPNKDYWEKREFKTEEIKVIMYATVGELYNAFKLGNIDILNSTINNTEEYIGTIGFNKKEYKGREYEFLSLNTQNQELVYQEVRQAIEQAIDKNNMIATVFGNTYYRADFPIDYGSWLYDNEKERPSYNPDLAKQILAENGWEYKGGTWQKIINYRTQRTNFDLIVPVENETYIAIANLIKQQLESVGMKITVRKVSETQYRNYINNKNYEMIIMGMTNAIAPNLDSFFGQNNFSKFNHEEINTIISDVRNIQDREKQKEKYNRIADIFFEQSPYIGLYRNKNTVIYNQKLNGEITPNWYNIFYHINEWRRQK